MAADVLAPCVTILSAAIAILLFHNKEYSFGNIHMVLVLYFFQYYTCNVIHGVDILRPYFCHNAGILLMQKDGARFNIR